MELFNYNIYMDKIIYLDNAATTRPYKEVLSSMQQYHDYNFYNPSSVYSQSIKIKNDITLAREYFAKSLNASSKDEIIFTCSGTEANNWAIKGIAEKYKFKGNHIITSAIEHHSVLNTMYYLAGKGYEVTFLQVDKYGCINIQELKNKIKKNTILVSVMYANNEIGTIEPIDTIGSICHDNGILFHTDAVQAYGHINIDVQKSNIDLLSVSGHKFHGPKGIGFMYKKKAISIDKIFHGGEQEYGLRPGTENVAGIMGMYTAAKNIFSTLSQRQQYETKLRDYFIDRILSEIPYTHVNGDRNMRLSNNINVSFNFVEGESLLLLLNKHGICASTGSACASGGLDPSHVLLAIGLRHEVAHGTLRFTIDENITKEDIDFTVEILKSSVAHLRDMSPLYEDFINNNNVM